MAFDCAHPDNRILTPEFIETADGLHKIGWTKAIGEIPPEWAHTVLYDYPIAEPKLIHFTAGVPLWPEIKGVPFTDLWEREANAALSAVSWQKLMGNSVHVERVRAFHAQKAGLRDQTADVGNGAGRGAPEAPAGAGHGR
jgi:hypothetical protein